MEGITCKHIHSSALDLILELSLTVAGFHPIQQLDSTALLRETDQLVLETVIAG
jgi:hypothetical protein